MPLLYEFTIRDNSGYNLKNRVRRTIRDAGHAFDAFFLIDFGRLLLFPRNCTGRTPFKTDTAFDTFVLIHLEFQEGGTTFCGASLLKDMGLIFIPEIL
jgi:hypothetical protein